MLRFSLGVTRLDRIRNEYIRGTAHVGRLGDKVREARLRWFGHVQRRETSGVNVHERGKRDSNDLSCPHYLLQGLAIRDNAIPKPGSDAAAQDALDGPSVEHG
ncbi:hypothetical protein QTP70_011394 [Hemibagrus guttatus]|uniref:Uncharacterized protein n=1 Tax=Hemibagrus guttatus TaxID=175788 RepID=A0AAE0QM55_9TELE|nr:hypothetical protein QTP70_011394 [Hemibagrus guttatus]